jgi:two-component sensor histidine kinase
MAVGLATDRMVLQWIAYLRRIADLYGGGRLRIEPVRARDAPVEIRALANTLDQMANRIAEREGQLQDMLDQKTALLQEIHHRVKNNLQIIISLLNIQISNADDPTVIATLDDARSRINALALVHKSLYEAEDLRSIPIKPFLEELMMQLSSALGASGSGVQVDLDVEPLALTTVGAVPLALFATECTTNAFKHAFDGRSSGRVRVRLKRANGAARLDVEDDGVGWKLGTPDRHGVGGSLMDAFARQLGGSMETGASELGGARVSLTFPAPSDAP